MNIINLTPDELKQIQKLELEALLEIDRICRKHSIKYSLACGSLLGALRHGGFIPWDDDLDIIMTRNEYERFHKICNEELSSSYYLQSKETDSEYFRLYSKLRVNGTVFKEPAHSCYKIHHGVYVDIFPLDNTPSSGLARYWHILSFSFFSFILSAKYINIASRHGYKKMMAIVLDCIFAPFSKEYLYKKATSIAAKYKDSSKKCDLISFSGAYYKYGSFNSRIFKYFKNCSFEGKRIMIISNADKYLRILYGDYWKLPPMEQRKCKHELCELELPSID
ncbi:MAG: LicD family protein [Ruminococcus sp.]|nr:LicD family protein [Ruminococcus sp.]